MCADPAAGETRHFLASPRNCEVAGLIATPGGGTMFAGIQHPGENGVNGFIDNSTWPDSGTNGVTATGAQCARKPRPFVVTRDGGMIGSG